MALKPSRRGIREARGAPVFCVGLPKCGTHSLAEMLEPACRSAHEAEAEALLPMLGRARSGGYAAGELAGFLRERDRRLRLDFEASHLLSSFVSHLVDTFPEARFMLVLRDCPGWIDSMINDQLNLRAWDGYARWQVVYDEYLGPAGAEFPPEESILAEHGLYPLSHYVRYWREEPRQVIRAVPRERLLVMHTEGLASSTATIADWVGVAASEVRAERSHSYRSPRRHEVLAAIDAAHVERVLAAAGERPAPG